MINKISLYLFAKGYSNAKEGGYKIKKPYYSKCTVNMQRSGEYKFHRFLPDIDLSLHGDDFDYFEGLTPVMGEQQKITVRLIVEKYLGTEETRTFVGVVSRKSTEWDFDIKKATLSIEWQDGYSALLSNIDSEYNVLRMGTKSQNVDMYVPPILQIYKEGSTNIDNYVGGEHFESQGDSGISLADLKDLYHFGEIGLVTGFNNPSVHYNDTIEVVAANNGCTVDDFYSPRGDYYTELRPSGFGFNNLSIPNNRYYRLEYRALIEKGATMSVSELQMQISNLPSRYDRNTSSLKGTEGSDFAVSSLIYNGELQYTIGYVALVSLNDEADAAYHMKFSTLGLTDRKIELLVFYGITTASTLTLANNNSVARLYATLYFSEKSAMLGRLIVLKKDDRFGEPYGGYDLTRDDPFMDTGNVYKGVIPLSAYDNTHNTEFGLITIEQSARYETDVEDGANEYGCYTDNLGVNKYYLPPSGYYDKNTSLAWYPVQRGLWGSTSFWVRFGRPGTTINFWNLIGQSWVGSKKLKDAYGFDAVINALVSKFAEDTSDDETHTDRLQVREMRPVRIPTSYDYITPFFSEFFELVGNRLRFNQYSTPLITPSSNVIAGDYDQAAQNWKLSLKKVLGWLIDLFNVYPVIRTWYEWDMGVLYRFPCLTFEHLAFFEQGHVYGWDAEGKCIDITEGALRDAYNLKRVNYGQDKTKDETANLPKRYELSCYGNGGALFKEYNVDMALVEETTDGFLADTTIDNKCSVKKIAPNGIYTDIDRIYAHPGDFDKGQSVMLMTTRYDNAETVCLPSASVIFDGKNGKKYLYVGNFNGSWMNLGKLHTRYVHTLDKFYANAETEGVLPDSAILPYIDCVNNGSLTTAESYTTPNAEFGANPYGDVLLSKTSLVEIEFPLLLDRLVSERIELDAEEYLYAVKFVIAGKTVKGVTESAELNLLTGKGKFRIKTKPIL